MVDVLLVGKRLEHKDFSSRKDIFGRLKYKDDVWIELQRIISLFNRKFTSQNEIFTVEQIVNRFKFHDWKARGSCLEEWYD